MTVKTMSIPWIYVGVNSSNMTKSQRLLRMTCEGEVVSDNEQFLLHIQVFKSFFFLRDNKVRPLAPGDASDTVKTGTGH